MDLCCSFKSWQPNDKKKKQWLNMILIKLNRMSKAVTNSRNNWYIQFVSGTPGKVVMQCSKIKQHLNCQQKHWMNSLCFPRCSQLSKTIHELYSIIIVRLGNTNKSSKRKHFMTGAGNKHWQRAKGNSRKFNLYTVHTQKLQTEAFGNWICDSMWVFNIIWMLLTSKE